MKNIGVYIHIPFCNGKCPYCDFYSIRKNKDVENQYVNALISRINESDNFKADTLYVGGGTPSCIDVNNLTKVIETAIYKFNIDEDAEITVECNPSDDLNSKIPLLASAGVNRISMGLQSANDDERKALGRKASPLDVENAIKVAKENGIQNISLDLMLGIPNQTKESLKKSIDFCVYSGVTHISAYILKLEPNTFFYNNKDKLNLPDEDETAELYMYCCNELEKNGFYQYEISNFSKDGYESKHNLKYWNCEEYLGIGASAHSFIDGKRFYYNRSIEEFTNHSDAVQDGTGGSFEEYVMMRLRLANGLQNELVKAKYEYAIPDDMIKKAKELEKHSLVKVNNNNIALTKQGFLLSNSIIVSLI